VSSSHFGGLCLLLKPVEYPDIKQPLDLVRELGTILFVVPFRLSLTPSNEIVSHKTDRLRNLLNHSRQPAPLFRLSTNATNNMFTHHNGVRGFNVLSEFSLARAVLELSSYHH
jgi:hypothetical protein